MSNKTIDTNKNTKRASGLISLIKRNIKLYIRTPSNIVFSLLIVIVVFALHFIIFRDMSIARMMHYENKLGVDRSYITWLVDNLMLAALLPLAAVSISLVTLAQMVSDKEKDVFSDFLVSPIGNRKIMAGYLTTSVLISFVIMLLLIFFFWIFLFATAGIGFSFVQFLLILASSIGAIIFGNIMILFIVSFLKKQQSVNGVGTAVGAVLGFLSGAYVPIGILGNTAGTIFGLLPFLQMTVLSRQAFLYRMTEVSPITDNMIDGRFNGFELYIGNSHIPILGVILMLSGITVALLVGLITRFARLKKEG